MTTPLLKHAEINVVCATDDGYAMPCAAMVRSLVAAADPGRRLVLHLLNGGMSLGVTARLNRSLNQTVVWGRTRNVSLHIMHHDPDLTIVSGLSDHGYLTTTTYLRLLVPQTLSHVDRAVWIDCDVLVCRDIAHLGYSPAEGGIDLGGSAAAAVVHEHGDMPTIAGGIPRYAERTGRLLDPDAPYYNAGVLVLDLSLWRKERISEAILKDLNTNQHLYSWWDQDGLNAILTDRWTSLDMKWNTMSGSLNAKKGLPGVEDVSIFHFCAIPKPWRGGYVRTFTEARAVFQAMWLKASRESGWFSSQEWIAFRMGIAARDARLALLARLPRARTRL